MDPQGLFFSYDIGPIVLNALAQGVGQVQVLDWDFQAMFLVSNSTGRYTIQIVDGATKFQFSNQQIVDTNIAGTAQNPFPLLVPYIFKRRGQIQINLTDLSNAGNTIRFTLHGVNLGQQV